MPSFVTWRLFGSLPDKRAFYPESTRTGHGFSALDRLLDTARTGPLYLSQAPLAQLVQEQLGRVAVAGLCQLHAFVVMPNHVHVLWTPEVAQADLVRRVKGATACFANRFLGRTGERFWQEEYFDRTVRNVDEFGRVRRYIEWNPVRAGFARQPEEYSWSSASAGRR